MSTDGWSAGRVYIGVSVLVFSSYQQPTFHSLTTCHSVKFNYHTIMASLPDDAPQETYPFPYQDGSGQCQIAILTASPRTSQCKSEIVTAMVERKHPLEVLELVRLCGMSMRSDFSEWVRVRQNATSTRTTGSSTANNQNPSTSAADNQTDFKPEKSPAPTKQVPTEQDQ